MYVRQCHAMDNWEAASDQGGNLLVQNACLDHFRDGLSDGRTPQPINQSVSQLISQSAISNQSISHRAVQQGTVIPPWWMLLPNWPLLNQSINQQSAISHQSVISHLRTGIVAACRPAPPPGGVLRRSTAVEHPPRQALFLNSISQPSPHSRPALFIAVRNLMRGEPIAQQSTRGIAKRCDSRVAASSGDREGITYAIVDYHLHVPVRAPRRRGLLSIMFSTGTPTRSSCFWVPTLGTLFPCSLVSLLHVRQLLRVRHQFGRFHLRRLRSSRLPRSVV